MKNKHVALMICIDSCVIDYNFLYNIKLFNKYYNIIKIKFNLESKKKCIDINISYKLAKLVIFKYACYMCNYKIRTLF